MSFDLIGINNELNSQDAITSAQIEFESGLRFGLGMPKEKLNSNEFKSGETIGTKAKTEKRILELMTQSSSSPQLRDLDTNISSAYNDGWKSAINDVSVQPAKIDGTKQDWPELARYAGFIDGKRYVDIKAKPKKIAMIGSVIMASLAIGGYLIFGRK